MSDERLQRQATTVAGALYGGGAVWVTLSLVVPSWPDLESVPLILVGVAVAYVVAGWCLLEGRRGGLSFPVLVALNFGGTAVASLVVYGGGAGASGVYGGFYGYVAAFAFFYFATPLAVGSLAFCGLSYGIVLGVLDLAGAPAQWVTVIGIAGGGAGLIGVLGRRARDVVDRERAAVERLRELDEMKSLFVQAVSHELRTPLAGVIGCAATLERYDTQLSDDKRRELVSRLMASGQKLDRLLVDLLDLERLGRSTEETARTVVDLGALAHRVVGQLDIDTHPIEVEANEVRVEIEAVKVERILSNLVLNAVKHTAPGTPIRVLVQSSHDRGALLVVEDEGPGVDESLKSEIFQPFRQGLASATMAQPGTGIGLSLVDRFARLHGGRVWVEDRDGGGARFVVRLPAETTLSASS